MSDQCPLLYEEVPEEDWVSPHSHRRVHMSRARARNNVKGAAAIITRWPEHWNSLLTLWWSGIAMIVLSTFFIYNFLFSYATIQSKEPFSFKSSYIKTFNPVLPEELQKPNVFMHIFLDNKQELNLDNYLHYIEVITNNYTKYHYEIIVVANDTNADASSMDDEKNEQALNTILTGDFKFHHLSPSHGNIHIKYTTLSQYMSDSPLRKYWKSLPYQFTKFLVRAISVWERGGIAFDPVLLTPQSPHSLYIDKIHNILLKYKLRKEKLKSKNRKHPKSKSIPTHKMNNIRDIINALSSESEDPIDKPYQDTLIEAETKNNLTVLNKRHLFTPEANLYLVNNKANDINSEKVETPVSKEAELHYDQILNNAQNDKIETHNSSSPESHLLSLFLNYLFYNEKTMHESTTNKTSKKIKTTINTKKYQEPEFNEIDNFGSTEMGNDGFQKPAIISTKGIFATTNMAASEENDNLFDVTIDLKGNIIATDTACHSFIGGLFSNAIHHDQSEAVTDFILKELTFFCKGLLASCVGIDVILL